MRTLIIVPVVAVVAAIFACSGGGDGGSSSGTAPSGNAPFQSCVTAKDGGSTSSSSSVCADNPALAGCRLCLELDGADAGGDDNVCVYACRMNQAGDCPAGQTCTAQPGRSRSSGGTCRDFTPSRQVDELGYCR